MTPDRAALEALTTLTVCDVCMSVYLSSAWCHDQSSAEIITPQFKQARAALATPPAPEAAAVEREECQYLWSAGERCLRWRSDHGPDSHPFQPAPTPPAPTGSASAEALRDVVVAKVMEEYEPDAPLYWAARRQLVADLDAIIAAARSEVYAWVAQNEAKIHAERDAVARAPLTAEALARALHAECEADWDRVAEMDPTRLLTMHSHDAHLTRAERILAALAAQEPGR